MWGGRIKPINNPFSNRNHGQVPAALNCSEKSGKKKGTAGSNSGGGNDDQMKGEVADSDWEMDEFDGIGSVSANSQEAEEKMAEMEENDVKMGGRIGGDDVEESKPMGMNGGGGGNENATGMGIGIGMGFASEC
jgi:hypothetical protein